MIKTKHDKFLEAVDTVCLNCVEDTINNPGVCENCAVRKTCDALKMQRYYVTYRVDARYLVEVEAENIEEAKRKAESKWYSADFGVAEDIGGEQTIIEDEDGNILWEV